MLFESGTPKIGGISSSDPHEVTSVMHYKNVFHMANADEAFVRTSRF